MTILEWEKVYQDLDKIYSKFIDEEYNYNNCKTKALTKKAEENLNHQIFLACAIIEKNIEVDRLLTGAEQNNVMARTFYYDDFKKIRYFSRDLHSLLVKIKEIINQLKL